MKKITSHISILLMILAMGLTTSLSAQHRRHGGSYSNSGTAILRGLQTAESIARVGIMGASISKLDDYTGIRFGYNAAALRAEGFSGSDLSSSTQSGLNVGIVWGWYLGNSPFIIEPGLYYSFKGGDLQGYDGPQSHDRYSVKTNMHTLEIPLVFKYEVQCRNLGACLQPFFGGFLSVGLGGKTKDSYYREKFDTYDHCMDRTDAGLRMGCGLGMGHFFLEAAYDCGLVNLASDSYEFFNYDNFSDGLRSNTFSIGIGFNF